MRSRGSLRTAQSALQKAISKKESVGEAYRGFMSEVKEELEVWLNKRPDTSIRNGEAIGYDSLL